jgi:hypothetical protein
MACGGRTATPSRDRLPDSPSDEKAVVGCGPAVNEATPAWRVVPCSPSCGRPLRSYGGALPHRRGEGAAVAICARAAGPGVTRPAGRGLVPAVLHQDVQDVAVLVDGSPPVLLLPVDLDEDLVQVPFAPGPGLSAAQRACVGLPELGAPAADRLVGDDDPALERQLLDLTEAEREPEVQPHAVGDHLDRVPVPLVRRRHGHHRQPPPARSTRRSSHPANQRDSPRLPAAGPPQPPPPP